MSRKPTVMSYDCDGTNYVTTIGGRMLLYSVAGNSTCLLLNME